MWKPLEIVTLCCFSVGLAPGSPGAAPIVNEPGGMFVSLSRMLFVTCLAGGDGLQPEQQTAAPRSKRKTSSEEWRIGRMCRNGGCEQLGAQVRNRRPHGSRTLERLKLPIARGKNTEWFQHLRSGVGEMFLDYRDR
jgi:hypothetical protein